MEPMKNHVLAHMGHGNASKRESETTGGGESGGEGGREKGEGEGEGEAAEEEEQGEERGGGEGEGEGERRASPMRQSSNFESPSCLQMTTIQKRRLCIAYERVVDMGV
jgi:hypothetical protein